MIKLKNIKNYSVIIGIITLTFIVAIIVNTGHERNIIAYIHENDGVVVDIENEGLNMGPFKFKGKFQQIYRFEFMVDGSKKEGWARLGGLHEDYIVNGKKVSKAFYK